MNLELWRGTESLGQSRGTPRGIALSDGRTAIIAAGVSGAERQVTIVDFLGNVVSRGWITLTENFSDLLVLDILPRADGGYDLLFGTNYFALPILRLARLDADFEQVGALQTVAAQFNGFGEMRPLADGGLAILYGTFQSGIQNAGLRIAEADGTLGPVIQANGSANPGPLFLQVATSGQTVFTAWLDTAAALVRGRLYDQDGNALGAQFTISTGGTGDNRILLERLSDGGFIAVWAQRQNNDSTLPTTLYARRFDAAGAPLGNQFVINPEVADGQSLTGLAATRDGGFLVTFETQSGTSARLFDASGTPLTPVLAVPGISSEVALVPIGDGRFVAAGSGTSAGFAIIDARLGNFDGDGGDNVLTGSNSRASTVNGRGGNDRFFGGAQDDTFIGGAGRDQFTPGEGNNTLIGGPSDDFYFLSQVEFSSAVNTIVELPGEGFDVVFTRASFTLPANVEAAALYGGTTPANLTGNAGNNSLTGNDGPNTLIGLAGNDGLGGGGGNDVLLGGDGNDTLRGEDGDDRLEGGADDDRLLGGEGNDVLLPGTGTDYIEGNSGDDEIRFLSAAEASAGDVIDGGAGIDSIVLDGAITAFDLSALSFSNVERIAHFGGQLALTLRTAQFAALNNFNLGGQVTYAFADAGSVVLAAQTTPTGLTRVRLSDAGNSLDARTLGIFNLTIDGGAGSDIVRLGTARGIVNGGAGADQLFGGNGDDVLNGGDDGDLLMGGADNDTLNGGSNIDTAVVRGSRAAYTVTQTSTGVFRVVGPDGTDTLTAVEFLRFDDQTIRLLPGTGVSVNFNSTDRSVYQSAMNAIRDFDGNALGGNGNWLRIGQADVNGDGDIDQILVNRAIGRFATVGTAPDGLVYFSDHNWAGETRVAGIYIDPLVAAGVVQAGSGNDSQRRFQNDLQIENINRVLGAGDYDRDGLQEVYFALTDGTAYLRAIMEFDGNIRYANYQSQQGVIDYLTANGFNSSTWAGWFPPAQQSSVAAQSVLAEGALRDPGVLPPAPAHDDPPHLAASGGAALPWPGAETMPMEFYG